MTGGSRPVRMLVWRGRWQTGHWITSRHWRELYSATYHIVWWWPDSQPVHEPGRED